jgi:hypothetical protein
MQGYFGRTPRLGVKGGSLPRSRHVSLVECACGCGELTRTPDRRGRPRKYKHGHQFRGHSHTATAREALSVNAKARVGEKNSNWKGGRRFSRGYLMLRIRSGNRRYPYTMEHILIAETAIRRQLKRGEMVHHINGDRTDNRSVNLLVCTVSYHKWLHNRMSKLYQLEHFK